MKFSPGVLLLFKTAVGLSLPSVLLVTFSKLARSHFGIVVPTWLLWTLCLTSAPFIVACTVWFNILREKYGAWRLGAQPLPRLRGRWFGDIDLLLSVYETHKEGYFCTSTFDCPILFLILPLQTRHFGMAQITLVPATIRSPSGSMTLFRAAQKLSRYLSPFSNCRSLSHAYRRATDHSSHRFRQLRERLISVALRSHRTRSLTLV